MYKCCFIGKLKLYLKSNKKQITMDTAEVIKSVLIECAMAYNPKNPAEWHEKRATIQIAEDIANKLKQKHYRLIEIYSLREVESDPFLSSLAGE